ncbi:MAG: tRNA lysidine(34) synthetase TilS [Halobacteriovoraceae bacterium]|nr:tRNA lysidine(34) synthetase TilS [Halobacteriovoraceae bacterium]
MKLYKPFSYFVKDFSFNHGLIDKNSKILVAVSGGGDSMALLSVIVDWYESGFLRHAPNACYVHHNTRGDEHDTEMEVVKNFCHKHTIYLHIHKVDKLPKNRSNLENFLREKRKKIFEDIAKQMGAVVATAHHIDDSFEWSLMQTFKTASLKSILGIPVKNNYFIRPFMCVSKKHIQNFCDLSKISFVEDSSNRELHFERNYIRHKIIPLIRERYPQHLKKYVYRANQMAKRLGVHARGLQSSELTLLRKKDGSIIYLKKFAKNFEDYLEEIKAEIIFYSGKKRGKIADQLQKLLKAIKNGRLGPLNFSGGVRVYNFSGVLFVTNQKVDWKSKKGLPKKWETMNFKQYKEYLFSRLTKEPMASATLLVSLKNSPYLAKLGSHTPLDDDMHNSIQLYRQWSKNKHLLSKSLDFQI